MNLLRLLFIPALAGAALAQMGEFGGPSILSRGGGGGTAPAAPIAFRMYLNLSGIYVQGLMGTELRSEGGVPRDSAYGAEGAVGLYGYKAWRHTVVGVNYRGDYRRYTPQTSYSGTNQFLALGVTHEPSRRWRLTFREGAGTFSQSYGYMGTFGFFDPTFAHIPQDELLNTRTTYLTTMADATWMKSPRLSFNMGGTGFTIRRQYGGLYGVVGASARGDTAYRLSRRTTIGGDYFFTRFEFTKAFGSADVHSVGFNYALQFSRWWSLAVRIGGMRVETLSLGIVNIDPVIAAIIGQQVGYRASYSRSLMGSFSGQLSRTFRRASASVTYSDGAAPGNGVLLASKQRILSGGYMYTGMRHWSLGSNVSWSDMRSIGLQIARYRAVGGTFGVTRSLGSRNMFLTWRLDARRYDVGTLVRNYYTATAGFAWSPGDIPLRLW